VATFVQRQLKNGAKRVKAMVRRKNAPSITQTFSSRREAEIWAMTIEGEILSAPISPRIEATRHNLREAIARYKATVLCHRSRIAKDQLAQLEWWVSELGDVKLDRLTGPLICGRRDKLAMGTTKQGKPRQPGTVNRYLAALSHVLSTAARDWAWLPESPMARVRKMKEPRGRVRYLTDQELPAFMSACEASSDPHLRLIVMLALSTGMRRGEIVGIRWGDIDWERRRVILTKTKNGERRAVPLPTKALEALRLRSSQLNSTSAYVFSSVKPGFETKRWDFSRAWHAALRRAGIKNFRFHDLRHSCASYLAMNGATTMEIAEVLGHKTLAMVRRYSHLADGHVAGLVERLEHIITNQEGAEHERR
jgi:integrase